MRRDDLELEAALDQGGGFAENSGTRIAPPPEGGSLDARLVRHLLGWLGNPPIRIVLWNGESIFTAAGKAVAAVRVASRSDLLGLLIQPEMSFGEGYSSGTIEVEGDLVQLLEQIYRGLARAPSTPLRRLTRLFWRRSDNTPASARENIHHHYDLGNAFYQLWLDAQMLYTCAYFPEREETLEQAQIAKMDHVCRKLRLRTDEAVVEAGCGWGALALHMASHYGVRVKAFNISRDQMAYARARARSLGVEARVEFIEDDYRNCNSRCDAFVSIGMLEHVGLEHYDELGRLIDRCLSENGRGLIHSIGRNGPAALNPWIERRIFPGAYPPALREMLQVLEPSRFSVLDVENLRLHYALTLEHWLRRFEGAQARVREMYDERFVRSWRLYLAGSIAAFTTGEMQLFQVLFARSASNDVPWTRAYLYES